ncbi:MAG: hypothetical protein WCV58_00670 [Patescibacteria group bacterium]
MLDKLKLKKFHFWQRIFAVFLISIGVLGIVLPVLPGWPFFFWGIFLLGGLGLVDQLFLRYLPKKYRGLILMWIETFKKRRK